MVAALICAVVQVCVSKLLRNAAENVTGLQSRPNIDFLVVGTIYRVDVLRQLLADLDGARCIVDDGFQKQPFVPLHRGLHVSDEVEIVGIHEETKKTVVTGVEMFRKLLDEAQAGDNIGALLRGIQRTEIERGQVLCKPGSVTCHHKFTAQVYVLTKDEGGRHTPFFNNYRPQFYFRTTDVTGVCDLPDGVEMCMPGDNIEMTIELIHPVAMEQGLTFAIREGGRTVGSGRVATVIE